MANFDYNEYKKNRHVLNAYYESLGFNAETVWGIYEDLESLYNDRYLSHCPKQEIF